MIERQATGTFHTVSPQPPFGFADMLNSIVEAVAPAGTTLTWVDGSFLIEQGVSYEDLPLWDNPGPDDLGMACDGSRATAAGLNPRPLTETVRETLDHERAEPTPGNQGLSRQREAEVLKAWANR